MENILAEHMNRDMKVSVTSEILSNGWVLYAAHIETEDGKIRLGQFELMPLVRMLHMAYEVIHNEEEKKEADEAVPAEA